MTISKTSDTFRLESHGIESERTRHLLNNKLSVIVTDYVGHTDPADDFTDVAVHTSKATDRPSAYRSTFPGNVIVRVGSDFTLFMTTAQAKALAADIAALTSA